MFTFSETIAYFSFVVGCMRAGYTVFALSPRNNPPAVTHLLEKVGATHICVSGQPALKGLCAASLAGLSKKIPVLDMPEYDTLYTGAEFVAFPKQTYDRKAPAVILHSSGKRFLSIMYAQSEMLISELGLGSTSFPKPIIRTHEALVEPGRTPCTSFPLSSTKVILLIFSVSRVRRRAHDRCSIQRTCLARLPRIRRYQRTIHPPSTHIHLPTDVSPPSI